MGQKRLIEELKKAAIPLRVDERGAVADLSGLCIRGLHVVTMEPGTARGNHMHDRDEIICVLGGNGICEITVQDERTDEKESAGVEGNLRGFRIKAGIRHTIKNTGNNPFYLVCFYEAAPKSSAS